MRAKSGLAALCATALICGVLAFSAEEQALLIFAAQLDNFQAVAEANNWHGWGLDDNPLCPEDQESSVQEILCEPQYPHHIDATHHSWTGVTCDPNGGALCLSLPGWGLTGNVSAVAALSPLNGLQMLNLANNSLSGPLPARWSTKLHQSNGEIEVAQTSLAAVYLSNNSISGSLPPLWGDKDAGFEWTLSRLYLSDNQLTGQLPVAWSEGDVLYQLSRIDLFGNQMTGSIPWSTYSMPSLENMVLLPGNGFCGPIPQDLGDVVRNFTEMHGAQQVLERVGQFDNLCITDSQLSLGGLHITYLGATFATLAGSVLALLLWLGVWQLRAHTNRHNMLSGKPTASQKTPSWHSETSYASKEFDAELSTDKLLSSPTIHSASKANHKFVIQDTAQHLSRSVPTPKIAHQMPSQTQTSVSNTDFQSTPYVSCETSATQDAMMQTMAWPAGQGLMIPAPLWQDVEIAASNISIAQTADGCDWVLGEGSYGMVYKGLKDGVHDVAIKIFKAVTTQRDLELLQTEIAVLRSCNNRNIVHFYGVCLQGSDAWLVMELLEKGNLYNALAHGKGLCTWYHRGAGIALDIAKGIHFLHSHHVMHLDLKSPNILLAQDGTAKIADVGLSRMFTARSLPVAKNTGTFHWMAPELISAGRCTEKADIFSFGIVLYEILTAEQPIRGRLKAVRVPKHCPQAIYDLMVRCQHKRPEARPAAADIIQTILQHHPKKHKLGSADC